MTVLDRRGLHHHLRILRVNRQLDFEGALLVACFGLSDARQEVFFFQRPIFLEFIQILYFNSALTVRFGIVGLFGDRVLARPPSFVLGLESLEFTRGLPLW